MRALASVGVPSLTYVTYAKTHFLLLSQRAQPKSVSLFLRSNLESSLNISTAAISSAIDRHEDLPPREKAQLESCLSLAIALLPS